MLFLRHFCRLICFWYFSTFYLENLPDTREPTPSACVFFFFFLACQFPVCVFNMFCCILTSFFRCSHSAVPALNTRPDSVRLWQLPLKTLENLKWRHSFSRRWISQRYRCLFFPFSAPFYLTSYAEALSPLKSTEHLLRMYLKLLKILSVAILLSLVCVSPIRSQVYLMGEVNWGSQLWPGFTIAGLFHGEEGMWRLKEKVFGLKIPLLRSLGGASQKTHIL